MAGCRCWRSRASQRQPPRRSRPGRNYGSNGWTSRPARVFLHPGNRADDQTTSPSHHVVVRVGAGRGVLLPPGSSAYDNGVGTSLTRAAGRPRRAPGNRRRVRQWLGRLGVPHQVAHACGCSTSHPARTCSTSGQRHHQPARHTGRREDNVNDNFLRGLTAAAGCSNRAQTVGQAAPDAGSTTEFAGSTFSPNGHTVRQHQASRGMTFAIWGPGTESASEPPPSRPRTR